MTDTVPAAARGLPAFDREAFAANLIAAGILSAGTKLPAIPASSDHPDIELLELGALLKVSDARCVQIARDIDAAYERYRDPPLPAAVMARESDFHLLSRRHCTHMLVGGEWRATWVDDQSLEYLRGYLARTEGYHPAVRVRPLEILAAAEAWKIEVEAAMEEAGLSAARRAQDVEHEPQEKLRHLVAALPARTDAGKRAKALSFMTDAFDPGEGLAEIQACLEAHLGSDKPIPQRILQLSLVADALSLGEAPVAGEAA